MGKRRDVRWNTYNFVKLWLSKNSEVSMREQLVTQIKLAIASGELRVGMRLPSTSEIARRFDVHPNTVSAAYQVLVDENFIELRKGSGFYVQFAEDAKQNPEHKLEILLSEFFDSAKRLGFDEIEISAGVQKRIAAKPVRNILVVDSDEDLLEILVHEIRSFIECSVDAISPEDFSANLNHNAVIAAMFDERPKLEELLSGSEKCVYLNGNSVASSMSGRPRPIDGDLIAVISAWDGFLEMARVMLLAAKIEPGNLIIRSRKSADWQSAIKTASMVICDSVTAGLLPASTKSSVFQVISDKSLEELRNAVQNNVF